MWFTENPLVPMLICGVCATVCFGLWNTRRHDLDFYLMLSFLGVMGIVYVVERSVVTEGERLQEDVIVLCDQFRRRDPATLDHFSDTVPDWKEVCKKVMEMVEIHEDLRLTDFRTTFSNKNSLAKVHFRANTTITFMGSTGRHPFRCILTYQKEGDGWKITDVQRLDPIKGENMGVMDQR